MMQAALILTLVVLCVHGSTVMDKYIFTEEEQTKWGARCLDGSGSGYYYAPATSSQSANKWVFNFEGGGYCLPNPTWPNVQDCAARAKSALGSSITWPAATGSTPPSTLVANWNQVGVPYCGGDLHTGQKNESVGGFYYAGHLTIAAIVQKLISTANLGQATDIMLTGGSAGGIAVFINIDYFQYTLPKAVVKGVPDAGWFIAVAPYNPEFIGIAETGVHLSALTDSYVNVKCAASLGATDAHLCISGNVSYPYISAPLFLAQSIFDQEQLVIEDGSGQNFTDPAANSYKIAFGEVMRETLKQVQGSSTDGIYATASFIHVVGGGDTTNGVSMQTTLDNWIKGSGTTQVFSSCTTPACKTLPTAHPSY